MHGWIFDIERTANNANNGIEHLLHIFFEVTETSPALGREYIQRAFSRLEGADMPVRGARQGVPVRGLRQRLRQAWLRRVSQAAPATTSPSDVTTRAEPAYRTSRR